MQKLLHFDTFPGDYTTGACVVSCFDARFEPAIRKFLKRRGIAAPDHVKIAGAAKSLAGGSDDAARGFVLDQIRTSVRRHAATRVLLLIHSDCGAYDGCRDAAFLAAELRSAADFVSVQLPQLEVECYLLDFEGVWTIR